MSRRDTIIIAVLVNAGLLMVLFATAMRSGKKEEKKELSQAPVKEELMVASVGDALPAPLPESTDSKIDPFALPTTMDGSDPLAFADEIDIPLTSGTVEAVPTAPAPTLASAPVTIAPVTPAASATPAPVAAAAPKRDEATIITVTVKKGDALEKIARANHSSVNAIMKANNLTSSNLKIGQVLKVPTNTSTVAKKESTPTPAAAASVAKKSGEAQYYVVKEGDSPWLIATRNNVKLDELLKLNGMDEQKARKLKPGDRLRIR